MSLFTAEYCVQNYCSVLSAVNITSILPKSPQHIRLRFVTTSSESFYKAANSKRQSIMVLRVHSATFLDLTKTMYCVVQKVLMRTFF